MCRKDRGYEAIGERDILFTGFLTLMGRMWQSLSWGTKDSIEKWGFDLAFI